MGTLPDLTPEQRTEALRKAKAARRERAGVRSRLKDGKVTLAAVIADAPDNDVIAGMKVKALLTSLPGLGRIRAGQVMDRIGIAPDRRIRGLGPKQTRALLEEFGGEPA
jgi:hypothetical protein